MNKLLASVAVAALVLALIALVSVVNKDGIKLGGITNFDEVDVTDGYRVDNTVVVDGSGNWDGAVTAGSASTFTAADFSGELEAALIEEGTLVTRTAGATTTISAANFCDANVVSWAPSEALASTTLPATGDVIADCLTTDGDSVTFLFRNTTTTSLTSVVVGDASTTLVASAAGDDQIDGGNEALITGWRTGASTMVIEIEELVAAD